MDLPMIKSLVLKDWRLNRSLLMIYLFSGLVASIIFSIEHKATFYIGLVLIISLFATVGTHLVFTTVIHERKEQTLPFIMSLPVNFKDYTIAKIIANLSLSLFSWGFIASAIMLVIWNSSNLPNGMIPYAVITIAELFVAYVLILSVAIIFESEGITVITMAICNISISLFMFWLGSFREINKYMWGNTPVWNTTALAFILCELAVVILFIVMTFYFQSRKKSFL